MEGLIVTGWEGPSPDGSRVEVVERKGKGHPDTICDELAEGAQRALLRYYEEHFGRPLHHNVDKALLWAGVAEPAFGGGSVVRPMKIFLAGRATLELDGATIPVAELAVESARQWLSENLHALDATRHVEIEPLIRPTSRELADLFARHRRHGSVLANDTSCGVGFAPFTPLERTVLEVERELSARDTTTLHPEIGEDVKVMGVRRGEQVDLTVACAFVGRHVADLRAYAEAKERVADLVRGSVGPLTDGPLDVAVNAADSPATGQVYLTVTGTSAEAGDDGQAGRGNRVTGLITPNRPMVMESTAGKNAVSHTGKVYSVVAQLIAQDLVAEVPEIANARCLLVSRIGGPVERPHLTHVTIRTTGAETGRLRPAIERRVEWRLETLGDLGRDLATGKISALGLHPSA